ncbi:MAG: putative phage abortive infection protein, partial [Muribaculaceae bacterium]|nr:putative phage abortive infection protein [Muribaculaceae bacterium]
MCSEDNRVPDENKSFWMKSWGFVTLILTCVAIFVLVYYVTCKNFDKPNEAGDTAGLANGLFSALAFAGVIYAIFLQKHELGLQRKELEQTRLELEAQKTEFKTQNDTLKRQRFENTFFNMLQLQQQITDNIFYSYKSFNNKTEEVRGREVFFVAFEKVTHWIYDDVSDTNIPYEGMRGLLEAKGIKEYEESFTPTYFDHYFTHLYRIIKFVEESDLIEDGDRYDYACLLRA